MSTHLPPRTFHLRTELGTRVLVAALAALVVLTFIWAAGLVLVALSTGGDGTTMAPGPLPLPSPRPLPSPLPGPQ